MRKVICVGNLVVAGGLFCLTTMGLFMAIVGKEFSWVLSLAVLFPLIWILLGIWQLRSRSLWAWIGNLVLVSCLALFFGSQVLKYTRLIWQAEYGDRTIELDPSTTGIPLACSMMFMVGFLVVLVALLSLPAWSRMKNQST